MYTVNVTTQTNCPWTATTATDWISFDNGQTRTGSGSISFSVTANTEEGRTGVILIAGIEFRVSQLAGCIDRLSAYSQNFPASGGRGDFKFTAQDYRCPGASGSSSTSEDWIHIGPNYSGGGIHYQFTVDANAGAARTGMITVVLPRGNQTFTVNQEAGTITPTCTYALGTLSQAFISAGDTGFVDVQAQAGCTYSSISNNDFITITSGASGAGSGTVTFTVAANLGAARTGTLFIAGQTFTVNQSGAKSRKRVRFF